MNWEINNGWKFHHLVKRGVYKSILSQQDSITYLLIFKAYSYSFFFFFVKERFEVESCNLAEMCSLLIKTHYLEPFDNSVNDNWIFLFDFLHHTLVHKFLPLGKIKNSL